MALKSLRSFFSNLGTEGVFLFRASSDKMPPGRCEAQTAVDESGQETREVVLTGKVRTCLIETPAFFKRKGGKLWP